MAMIESLEISANQWRFLKNPEGYVDESQETDRPLVLESTRRQFLTAEDVLARLAGSYNQKPRKGILLADDVGLGKTTVAALVAWVFAGSGKQVRILAPNNVMKRRWAEELRLHVGLLNKCEDRLRVSVSQIRDGNIQRLNDGRIQVAKHSLLKEDSRLKTDLLIVDEAHRAKGQASQFAKALKKNKKYAERILILTATPFSIQVSELARMLNLIGGTEANPSVKGFSKTIQNLYGRNSSGDTGVIAKRLTDKATEAVVALSRFVIRHGIENLPQEKSDFGEIQDWNIEIPVANPQELELLVRMDRVSRLNRENDTKKSKNTNDARYHVGWRLYDEKIVTLKQETLDCVGADFDASRQHLKAIGELRKTEPIHSKIKAIGNEVKSVVNAGEKVVLFCDYIATAQELTLHLNAVIPELLSDTLLPKPIWQKTWKQILPVVSDDKQKPLQDIFIDWLCTTSIRKQVWRWLDNSIKNESELADALNNNNARGHQNEQVESIVVAAHHLFHALLSSKSSQKILHNAKDNVNSLPGAKFRVLGICAPDSSNKNTALLFDNKQPDTAIAIFNSPFGPDVLVVTDKMSEGIDLHRYCRHLIHYELDPSPIRTIQRNGRLRRVNSWASITKQPIKIAYPAFRGTRDYKLVQIMKKRMDSFSLLLGGVPDFDVDEVEGTQEKWRNEVICNAKKKLRVLGRKLNAKYPRKPDN